MDKKEIHPVVIEFAGVTGVGKTTLIKSVKDNLLKQGLCGKTAEEFILGFYALNFISPPILRTILMDLLAFFPFVSFVVRPQGRQLTYFGIQIILRDSNNFLMAANLIRNLAKRIGIYVFLNNVVKAQKNSLSCDAILWDEGILQIAHNLFVHTNVVPNLQEIESFKNLIPQPEIVVWIKASPEQSIQCTLTRGHKRVKKDIDLVKQFVKNAALTFEHLFSDQTINTKLLIVDNSHRDHNNLAKEDKYTEQQVIQIIDLVKQQQEPVKC